MLAHRLPATALDMLVLFLAALLACAYGQSSQCSYTDPTTGYSLSWTTSNGQVNFNLTYTNFPSNSFTGVGFGNSMNAGIDAILVTVAGSQVNVVPARMMGYAPPNLLNDNSVKVQRTSYNNRVLNAQFSRALALNSNSHKSLQGTCNTWNFINGPGGFNNGQYTKHRTAPVQRQFCNINNNCGGGMMGGQQWNNNNNNQIPNSNQMYDPSNQNNNGGQQPQGSMMGGPMMGPGPVMMNNQQGQNFGWQPNMATPPPSEPYTGAPFVYTTSMDPTWGTSNGQQGQQGQQNPNQFGQNFNQQYMQSPQRNPPNQMNMMAYQPGQGSFPNQNSLNNPYQQNQQQQGMNQQQYNPSSQGGYNGYYGQQQQGMSQQNQYNQNQSSPAQNQSYYGRKRRSIRAKRQTPGYQPTNNIYGYDYSNSLDASASTTAPIVVNPNYKYLSGPLADEYSRSYAQEVKAYDQQTATGGSSNYGMNLNGNAPQLNNDQQNQANYQQIQRDYAQNPNPTAGQTYTNNIYGYNYGGSSTPSSNYYVQTNAAYYQSSTPGYGVQRDPNNFNNNNLFYPANQYASTASPVVGRQFDPNFQSSTSVYESGSNLKETRLRDPNQYNNLQGVQRDYIPGTSAQIPFEYTYYDPQTSLYYPYRTTSNFQPYNSTFYDDNGVVRSSEISRNQYSSSTSNPNAVFYNPSINSVPQNVQNQQQCTQADPAWCSDFVNVSISSQTQYNSATRQMACQQVKAALVNTYNGCCNTVRAAGC